MEAILYIYLTTLIYILIGGLPTVNCYCPSIYIFSRSACEFNYTFTDETCKDFQFTQCSWTVCSHYTSSLEPTCDTYQTHTSTNWATCTTVCCDSSKIYPYSVDSIQQCQADLNPPVGFPVVAIAAGIIGLFFFTSLPIVFCCFKDRIYSSCPCFKNCCEKITDCMFYLITCQCFGREEEQSQAKKANLDATNIQLPVGEVINWVPQETANEKLNDICSICLDGRPTVELECHHVYHRKCILMCLKRKFECAMCRSHSVNNAKIYCQNCMHNFQNITIRDHFRFLDELPQVCKSCKQAEENKVQLVIVSAQK